MKKSLMENFIFCAVTFLVGLKGGTDQKLLQKNTFKILAADYLLKKALSYFKINYAKKEGLFMVLM